MNAECVDHQFSVTVEAIQYTYSILPTTVPFGSSATATLTRIPGIAGQAEPTGLFGYSVITDCQSQAPTVGLDAGITIHDAVGQATLPDPRLPFTLQMPADLECTYEFRSVYSGPWVSGTSYVLGTVNVVFKAPEFQPTITSNPSCDTGIGSCSANIVRGDSSEQTTLYTTISPAASRTVQLSADFGTTSPATSVQTNASGKATVAYISGNDPQDSATTIGTVTATIGQNQATTDVYNFRGFSQYNFHQTQVPDTRFTAHTEWNVSQVQAFFVAQNSFLQKFYLLGQGDRGFYDTNGNGTYNTGEPKYCADPQQPDCSTSGSKTRADQAFINAATKNGQRVNPKLLLVQGQKEGAHLISSATLPSNQLLNGAFGCDQSQGYNTFQKQLDCGANTMADRFADAFATPYFYKTTESIGPIRHWVNSSGYQTIGFTINTKATFALYRYTPHTTTSSGGGGNYLFEQLWLQYGF